MLEYYNTFVVEMELIHQAGEEARVRKKKFWTHISKNLTT